MAFGKDFIFGAASASYQIEGGAYEDGKGLNIWDVYSHQEGKTAHGETGDTACDSYHRVDEDIDCLKKIGIKNYRFSISWARILPDGTGKVNEKGLKYYSDLVDKLLAAGITPYVTIFHWDYPYALYRKGGWLNDDSPKWFLEYTKILVDALSDRVSNWYTINEPQCFIGLGYQHGGHAPFLCLTDKDLTIMTRNVMLAHGMAVKYIRENAKLKPQIGFTPIAPVFAPEGNSEKDIQAAYDKTFEVPAGAKHLDLFSLSWWSDPIILGSFSKSNLDLMKKLGVDDIFKPEDFEIIKQPLDFYGCNIYYNNFTQPVATSGYEEGQYAGSPRSATEWAITPEVLYWAPKFLYKRYGLPVIITENGTACYDWICLDGKIHDTQRIDYIQRYLNELERASDEVPVKGYFYWSLLDNLEWSAGYSKRFGLVYVDFKTFKRTIKDSGYWFGNYIKEKLK